MAILSIRIDDNLRKGAEQAFNAMGLSLADGVRSYLTYVNMERRLPFTPNADPDYEAHIRSSHIPNEETQAAMQNVEDGKDLTETTWDEMRAMLRNPDA